MSKPLGNAHDIQRAVACLANLWAGNVRLAKAELDFLDR